MMPHLVLAIIGLLLAGLTSADPIVIAHRGASGYVPEHTLPAVAMAHAMDVDYIEQDVVLTRDDVPVILHDIHIDTVTDVAQKFPTRKRKDGRFYAVDFTLKELRTLDVFERFKHETGERYFPKRFPKAKSRFNIATLAEEIELIEGLNDSRNRHIGLYTEIKHPEFHKKEGKDITKIVYYVLRKYGYEKEPYHKKKPRVYLQCFHAATLKRLKKEFKTNIPLVQLIAENSWGESSTDYDHLKSQKGLKEISSYAMGIGPWMKQLVDQRGNATPMVGWAREAGLKIHTYTARQDQLPKTVKDFDTLHAILFHKIGVDGVFSDHPDKSLAWVHRNARSAKRKGS